MSKLYFFMDSKPADLTLAPNKREAWMPKNGLPYFDPSACRTFSSRAEKRAWLTQHKMRETGELVKADTRGQHGRGRERTKVTPQEAQRRAAFAESLQKQGGVNGLLDRLQRSRYTI